MISRFKFLKRQAVVWLKLTLAVTMVTSSPAMLLAAEARNNQHPLQGPVNLKAYYESVYHQDPMLGAFMKSEPFPDEVKKPFTAERSMLDRDPYFMRSQKWVAEKPREFSAQNVDDLMAYEEEESVLISGKGWNQSLRINLDLIPLADTGEFVIFSAAKSSNIFEDKLSGDESNEGLFYIEKEEVFKAAAMRKSGFNGAAVAVPVYYLPLPDAGWKGRLLSFQWGDTDQFVIYNSKDSVPLPIDLEDIRDHYKYMKLHLTVAKAMTTVATGNVEFPYPASGSTAAFGSFLTGVNLDSARHSIVSADTGLIDLKQLMSQILPTAHADTSLIDPAIVERLWFVGKIVGGGFVGSIALKYSIYRERFKQKHLLEDKLYSEQEKKNGIRGVLQSLGQSKPIRELRDVFDVYAHMLTFLVKAIPVNTINVIEYLQDRFATRAMAPSNGLIRKAFEATLGFSRDTMDKLAVNSKTWFLGSIVMGGVDTALVVFQLLVVTPAVLIYFGWAEPGNVANSALTVFVTSEIIRNITGYFNSGAYSYSADQKFIVIDKVNKEVDDRMRREGLDPKAKENQGVRKQRFNFAVDQAMRLRGLPSDDEFLFDAMSVALEANKRLGYTTANAETLKNMEGNFLFEQGRWGLASPALSRAVKTAKTLNSGNRSYIGDETLRILKELKSRWSYSLAMGKELAITMPKILVNYLADQAAVKAPFKVKSYIKESRDLRQALTLLSYGGEIKEVEALLPDWLKNMSNSKEAILAAARIYNSALYGVVEGDKDALLVRDKTKERVRSYLEAYSPAQALDKVRALEVAVQEAEEERGEDTHLVRQVKEIYAEAGDDIFLRRMAEDRAIRVVDQAMNVKTETESYDPKKGDFLAKWQKRRAHRAAKVETSARLASGEANVSYEKIYAKQMANNVALYPKENSEFVDKVEEEARDVTESQLSKPDEQAYISRLSPAEKSDYEAEVFGDNYLTAYHDLAVKTDEHLEATSTEKPGFLQRARQFLMDDEQEPKRDFWKKIKRSVVKTKFAQLANKGIRVLEGFWSNGSYQPGLVHFFDRNVPLWHDAWRNFAKSTRTWLWALSAGYLVAYHVWQVQFDYAVSAVMTASWFSLTMMVQLNNRVMEHLGSKPMGGVKEKAIYSWWHSWLTYPIFIPVMVFADDIVKWHDKNINQGVLQPAGYFIKDNFQQVVETCSKLLGG